jgi:hypothetical protein
MKTKLTKANKYYTIEMQKTIDEFYANINKPERIKKFPGEKNIKISTKKPHPKIA